jgi:hypothetical protein
MQMHYLITLPLSLASLIAMPAFLYSPFFLFQKNGPASSLSMKWAAHRIIMLIPSKSVPTDS